MLKTIITSSVIVIVLIIFNSKMKKMQDLNSKYSEQDNKFLHDNRIGI